MRRSTLDIATPPLRKPSSVGESKTWQVSQTDALAEVQARGASGVARLLDVFAAIACGTGALALLIWLWNLPATLRGEGDPALEGVFIFGAASLLQGLLLYAVAQGLVYLKASAMFLAESLLEEDPA